VVLVVGFASGRNRQVRCRCRFPVSHGDWGGDHDGIHPVASDQCGKPEAEQAQPADERHRDWQRVDRGDGHHSPVIGNGSGKVKETAHRDPLS
jgi:hypothetical protein